MGDNTSENTSEINNTLREVVEDIATAPPESNNILKYFTRQILNDNHYGRVQTG